jgi:hypothetical protein
MTIEVPKTLTENLVPDNVIERIAAIEDPDKRGLAKDMVSGILTDLFQAMLGDIPGSSEVTLIDEERLAQMVDRKRSEVLTSAPSGIFRLPILFLDETEEAYDQVHGGLY